MNPEALRFPSDLRVKVLIVIGLTVDLICAAVAVVMPGAIWLHAFDATVVCLLVALKLHWWPRELVADQFGLHSCGIFSRRNIHIPWHEVGAVRPSTEVPGFGPSALGLRNDTLEFQSIDGSARVIHTPHHPDRDRLVREARLRCAAMDVSALI